MLQTMKRLITTLLVGTFLCLVGFAQEFNNGTASGGFWCMEEGVASGFGEWSFPLHNDSDGLVLRDCINMGGFGGTKEDFGGAFFGNKLLVGKRFNAGNFVVRNYAIASVGFGLFSAPNHSMVSSPFLLGTIFGVGMELQYSKKLAFVIEFGGNQDFFLGDKKEDFLDYESSNPILMLGFRSYI